MRRLLALLVVAGTAPAAAQNLDPRSFVNTPVGINFVTLGYGYSTGNVLFDAAVAIEDADLTIQGPTGGIRPGPRSLGTLRQGRRRPGLGLRRRDGAVQRRARVPPRVRPHRPHGPYLDELPRRAGADAAGVPNYKQNFLVGAGFRVTAPLGQYDPSRSSSTSAPTGGRSSRSSACRSRPAGSRWSSWALPPSSPPIPISWADTSSRRRPLIPASSM